MLNFLKIPGMSSKDRLSCLYNENKHRQDAAFAQLQHGYLQSWLQTGKIAEKTEEARRKLRK